jgi:hypothetical protein
MISPAIPDHGRETRQRSPTAPDHGSQIGSDEGPVLKKMKAYASFDAYVADQSPKNQAIIRALRRFVKRVEPGLSEAVKWGNGCWLGKERPIAYVYSDTEYVQFGFFRGSSLKDPKGLLEGRGRYVRHIKVCEPSAIDQRTFAPLLGQAAGSPPGRRTPPSNKVLQRTGARGVRRGTPAR